MRPALQWRGLGQLQHGAACVRVRDRQAEGISAAQVVEKILAGVPESV